MQAAWRTNIEAIVAYIVSRFGGQQVRNADLKGALVERFPEVFANGRADACIEYLACVDFASCYTKAGPGGLALLQGVKDGGKRYWIVPTSTEAKAKAESEVGNMQAPLPTKARKCIRFGEYVAKTKEEDEEEEG